jgi:hypothetical protein
MSAGATGEVDWAFAILDLDPRAGADLVDLAYRYHVARTEEHRACRAGDAAAPDVKVRLIALERTRRILLDVVPPLTPLPGAVSAGDAPIGGDRAPAVRRRVLGLRRVKPRAPAEPPPSRTDHEVLAVRPAADDALVGAVYRCLLRRALAEHDRYAAEALERAYARIDRANHGRHPVRDNAGTITRETESGRALSPTPSPYRLSAARGEQSAAAAPSGQSTRASSIPQSSARDRNACTPVAGTAQGVLQVHMGPRKVLSIALQPNRAYTIGTDPRSDVRLPNPPGTDEVTVGFAHARLTVRPGRVLFHHLAEGVRSLVNDEPATWSLLEPGDRLGIGPYQCSYEALPLDETSRATDVNTSQRPMQPDSSVA